MRCSRLPFALEIARRGREVKLHYIDLQCGWNRDDKKQFLLYNLASRRTPHLYHVV